MLSSSCAAGEAQVSLYVTREDALEESQSRRLEEEKREVRQKATAGQSRSF